MENQAIWLVVPEDDARQDRASITVTHGCGERGHEDHPPNKSTWLEGGSSRSKVKLGVKSEQFQNKFVSIFVHIIV
jgi:hypothetical protein